MLFLFNHDCDDCIINLKEWGMHNDYNVISHNFTLITHWIDVVQWNQIRKGMAMHLWAFRKGSHLGQDNMQ